MRRLLCLLLTASAALGAQDPALRDTLASAKALWATQGDRDGAAAKFESILGALEPSARALDEGWTRVLCETYNWMAVLDDRTAGKKAQAPKRLESLLELDPDYDIDRTITNPRLQAAFDALRAARFGRVKLSLDPAGGVLTVDGKARRAEPGMHWMAPGAHAAAYARIGFQPQDVKFDVAVKDTRALDFKLARTSSVITVYTSPAGAELLVDGKTRGLSRGQVPTDRSYLADRAGVKPDQLSDGFPIADLAPGKHLLEVRLPCHRTRRLEIPAALTTPFADQELEPVKLEPSRGTLTVQSAVPGGQLILSGLDMGRVPVQDLQVCAQAYDLQVKYPAGSFTQRIEIQEGKALTLTARPKPRLTYAGFEGSDDFAGRERLLGMLGTLGGRLHEVAFFTAAKGESLKDCLARLRSGRETELILWARPAPGRSVQQVELILSTLTGQEERLTVMPLENDPLGSLAARMERQPALREPWAGLTLLDLPGGAYVLEADSAAQKAGVKPGRTLTEAGGRPVATVADFRKALAEATGGTLTVSQGEAPVKLAVVPMPAELPVNAPYLCYPLVLADLRLRYLGAQGDEASLLRLDQALALMHFREYDKALEVLRDARMVSVQGVSQGTLDYYTGFCLLHMGSVYLRDAAQSFNQALKYPQATLFGPGGPLLAPLARQALQDLQP
ncbi:PDZ domain-containing protein [Mesoterricola silvestris]|nr:PDZ domain-containing protein [Mesoterricola silvestris]